MFINRHHTVIPQYRDTAVPSYRSTVIPQYRDTAVPSYRDTVIPPHRHTASLSYCLTVILPHCQTASMNVDRLDRGDWKDFARVVGTVGETTLDGTEEGGPDESGLYEDLTARDWSAKGWPATAWLDKGWPAKSWLAKSWPVEGWTAKGWTAVGWNIIKSEAFTSVFAIGPVIINSIELLVGWMLSYKPAATWLFCWLACAWRQLWILKSEAKLSELGRVGRWPPLPPPTNPSLCDEKTGDGLWWLLESNPLRNKGETRESTVIWRPRWVDPPLDNIELGVFIPKSTTLTTSSSTLEVVVSIRAELRSWLWLLHVRDDNAGS